MLSPTIQTSEDPLQQKKPNSSKFTSTIATHKKIPSTHRPKGLIRCEIVHGGHTLFLARGTGELVLAEVVLNTVVTVALSAAGDYHGVLHQLLAEAAEQFGGRLQGLGGLFSGLLLPVPVVVNSLTAGREKYITSLVTLVRFIACELS